MNIELINTKTMSLKSTSPQSPIAITVNARGFYFSKLAAKAFGMQSGKYIHFGRSKDEKNRYTGGWYIVVNEDPAGFKITECSHDAARIFNAGLVRLFKQLVKCKTGDMYYLQKTESELNKCPVIEILTHKTVQEINKAS